MVEREIKWTRRALEDKISILEFWFLKTGYTDHPVKLENLFKATLSIVKHLPRIGSHFDEKRHIHFVIVRDYKIYNTFTVDEVTVLTIWDTRRNEDTFII